MANSPLKVGVVGMGGIGNTHSKAYIADALSELVCVCDVNKERADKAAAEYNVEAFYDLKENAQCAPRT